MQFYVLVHPVEELEDYICVSQQNDNGDNRAVLFVKMRKGHKLTPKIISKIGELIDRVLMEDCIPECIVEVPDIPVSLF